MIMRVLRLLTFLLLLSSSAAHAGVPCALPFNLQNGTPADATQVMANYNAIITCLTNAAAAGVNSDITQLTGLTAPLSPANGGTQTFVATTPSTGSGNAQVVANTTPTGFLLTRGYTVVFIAGASNTDATTLQVGSAVTVNVFRRTSDGALPAVGGEIVANTMTVATFDGTQFQIISSVSQVPIGTVQMTLAAAADLGFVLMQGQCLATAGKYNSLWFKLGSPAPGSCGAGNFSLPDGRGRVAAMVDSGGSGRITAAGGNFDGTGIGNSGGNQNHALVAAELAAHTHTITDPGHTHAFSVSGAITTAGAGANLTGGGGTYGTNTLSGTTASATTGITSTNSTGSGNAFSTLQPTLMVNMQVKY